MLAVSLSCSCRLGSTAADRLCVKVIGNLTTKDPAIKQLALQTLPTLAKLSPDRFVQGPLDYAMRALLQVPQTPATNADLLLQAMTNGRAAGLTNPEVSQHWPPSEARSQLLVSFRFRSKRL